jgi:uncharacterized sulfatase
MNKLLLLTSILAGSGCANPESKAEMPVKPGNKNVLFIVVDDLNTTLGCYGHSVVKTPNIDRLAQMGIRFNHAYCNYAVSNPSRSSLLTGLKPETTTILDNVKTIQSILGDRVTLPALFKQNGYHTVAIGKIFHGGNEHNDVKAWDQIIGSAATEIGRTGESRNMTGGALKWCEWRAAEGNDDDQPDGQNANKAVDFILSKKDKPFFLAMGLSKPHDPFVAPKKYFNMYPLEICNPPEIPEGFSLPYKHTLPGETTVFNNFTDNDKREFLRSYYACVSFMDAQVGKLLDALEESDQIGNTLIVFFGDHGYHLGEHNWWNKVTIFERGTNPPFIMAGYSVGGKGTGSDAMFEFIDIYPTLADIMGLKKPDYLEGKSFSRVVKNPSMPFRNEVHAVVNRGAMLGRTVKTKDWRYTEWDIGNKGRELYDQKKDPMEYHNIAGEPAYSSVVTQMRKLLYQEY